MYDDDNDDIMISINIVHCRLSEPLLMQRVIVINHFVCLCVCVCVCVCLCVHPSKLLL